jgi:D-tyrosyl-tRNA(Tyr) deacylase
MRAVIQRVSSAQVDINGQTVAKIGKGLLILLGIGPEDDAAKTTILAKKIAMMRIFEDDQEKMNLSLLDIHGEAIVVSQFTLYADTRRGNRPSFTDAAKPDLASPLVDQTILELQNLGVPTQSGVFGANMQVSLLNDGPVTILLDL